MARGPKPVPLTLSDEERGALEGIVRRRRSGQALVQRARIVLACAEPGSTNTGVAHSLGVSRPSVSTWRARFLAHRLDGLVDLPRSGAPRQVGDDAIERLIAIHAYIAQTNAEPKPFVWTKTADAILASVSRFCQRTSNSDH